MQKHIPNKMDTVLNIKNELLLAPIYLYYIFVIFMLYIIVIVSSWLLFAGVDIIPQRLYEKRAHSKLNSYYNEIELKNWFVGFVDGDGSFSVLQGKNGYWSLVFKVGQSPYNLRALYTIKKLLGVGKVYIEGHNAHFVIRDRKLITSIILPIFDEFPLLTSKAFYYTIFREACLILNNTLLTQTEKSRLIQELKSKDIPNDYISYAWSTVSNNVLDAHLVMSKSWLAGFTEAEGSFYIVAKSANRMVHAFGITQKLDLIVLNAIRLILGVDTVVRIKKTHFSLDITNSKDIFIVRDFYKDILISMKGVEYKIWSRSLNYKGDFEKLNTARNQYRYIKSLRATINLFEAFKK